MVNLRNIYNSLKKLTENAGLNTVEPFFMDPDVGASRMPQLPPKPPTEFDNSCTGTGESKSTAKS